MRTTCVPSPNALTNRAASPVSVNALALGMYSSWAELGVETTAPSVLTQVSASAFVSVSVQTAVSASLLVPVAEENELDTDCAGP